jgi:Tol biopolymer transport system component
MRLSNNNTVYSVALVSSCIISCLALLACVAPAKADSPNSVSKLEGRQVLSISRFSGPAGDQAEIVVRHDLDRISIFSGVREAAASDPLPEINALPDFAGLIATGVRFYLVGATTKNENTGQLEVQARLWDVANRTQLMGKKFTSISDNLRRASHLVAEPVQQS